MNSKDDIADMLKGQLTIAFVVLKLIGEIDWQWYWVVGPLWIPIVIGLSLRALISIFRGSK